jgi:hypothetical protein
VDKKENVVVSKFEKYNGFVGVKIHIFSIFLSKMMGEQIATTVINMSGFAIVISWGVFIFGCVELSKPHTDVDHNSLIALVVGTAILGPGITILILINACYWQHRQNRSHPLLQEVVYIA